MRGWWGRANRLSKPGVCIYNYVEVSFGLCGSVSGIDGFPLAGPFLAFALPRIMIRWFGMFGYSEYNRMTMDTGIYPSVEISSGYL